MEAYLRTGSTGIARTGIRRIISLIVGSVPGLALPFVTALLLTPASADAFLIALGLSMVLTAVIASTFEIEAVAEESRLLLEASVSSARSLKANATRAALVSGALSVCLLPVVAIPYVLAGTSPSQLLITCSDSLPVLLSPIFATISAAFSGPLIAYRSVNRVLISNGLRGGPTIAVLFLSQNIVFAAWSYLVGEVLRMLWMIVATAKVRARHTSAVPKAAKLSLRSHLSQVLWMLLNQGGPVIARAYLASAPVGSVAIGEMGFRVMNVSTQILSSGYLLGRIPGIAAVVFTSDLDSPLARRRRIRTELFRLITVAVGLGLIIAVAVAPAVLYFGWARPDPALFAGLGVGELLLVVLPFYAVGVWSARALTMLGRSSLLPLCSLFGLLVAAGGSAWSSVSGGGVLGVMLAFIASQVVASLLQLLTLIVYVRVPGRIGSHPRASERPGN